MIRLRGMTWGHPRGYGPMVATARAYTAAHPGVEIAWDRRSLQAFEEFPVDVLAREYDLLVIDHPHIGEAARAGCLAALDRTGRDGELEALARASMDVSHHSYQYDRYQWALAHRDAGRGLPAQSPVRNIP
ncbi:MAG: hypothetical protein HY660_15410 [Armatimonadetes bacterium]|nr:hypothetical protein [Armatimonadota bacterium]